MLEPGVYPASVTPMMPDGALDLAGVVNLLSAFRTAGCNGIVLAGTNGEGPSLSAVEKRDLVRASTSIFPDFPVITGIATPSLTEAIWLAQQARKAGAAAALVMPPFYFREASTDGILQWFEALMSASDLPVLVYNFPQRTGIPITPEMLGRLAQHPNMTGVKDSSGDRANLNSYAEVLQGRNKQLFVGNETLLWEALELGWSGTISGAANSIPGWLSRIVQEYRSEDKESSAAKFQLALPVLENLRRIPQPATHKAVLCSKKVLQHASVRLPLQEADESQLADALEAIQSVGG